MNILVAKQAGFCFGVQRAVDMALAHANEPQPVYTFGELIHNASVVADLKSKNILPVAMDELPMLPVGSKLIIRSHGVSPDILEQCRALGLHVLDATCPFVKRIHKIVKDEAEKGRHILIAGKPSHPEVEGIKGWAGPNSVILPDAAAALSIKPTSAAASLVAQTTLERGVYQSIVEALKKTHVDLIVHDTICDTTSERQKEAAELAEKCSCMIVVGGLHSSNTQNLASVCKKHCKHTCSIENSAQLLLEKIHSDDIIGVVAGASTPQWMIREVVTVMNELEKSTVDTAEVETTTALQQDETMSAEPAMAEATEDIAAQTTDAAEAAQAPQPETESGLEPAETSSTAVEAVSVEDPIVSNSEAEASDSGDSFAEAFEKTLVRIRNGQIITGSVVQIADGEVCVNIGYKSDGFIPRNEFSSDPDVNPASIVKVGDPIEVEVIKVNDGEGNVLLSRKSVEGKKLWEELMNDAETPGKVFEGVCKEVVKGGLIAVINGVRAFVPASHVSTKYVENLSDFVGQDMQLSVIEVDKSRKRIVASQKNVLLAQMEEEKKQRWATLEVGSKITGVVRRLTDFGAFVDIGGIDGLVHVTDVAWGRVKHPSDIFKIGQQIEVLVLNVDAEKERVSLGYKQLQPKPWTMAADKYPVGSIVEGKVVRIVPFGAFVALEPTIDGLIHISQVSVKRIAKVEDEINVGDTVRCKVLDVNPEAKRISLSRKEVILEENPEIAEQIAAERAERDRMFAERQEQRAAEKQQQQAQQQQRPARIERERPPVSQQASYEARPERAERRPRRSEDGDYELPPVQSTTTSLADLFQGLNIADLEGTDEE